MKQLINKIDESIDDLIANDELDDDQVQTMIDTLEFVRDSLIPQCINSECEEIRAQLAVYEGELLLEEEEDNESWKNS